MKQLTEKEFHRRTAVKTFNAAWELLDKKERTPEEQDEMVRLAHVSRWHWDKVGTALEFARGDQFLSQVYAAIGEGEPALRYGRRALATCLAGDIADFDIAFAYKSLHDAHAMLGNKSEAGQFHKLAQEAGAKIVKQEDRDYFLSVLKPLAE